MKLVFIIYMLVPSVWSDWNSLFSARSVEDLLSKEREIENMEEIRRRCRFQLQEKMFPEACLHEMALELEEPVSTSSRAVDLLWKQICSLCRRGADDIQSVPKIKKLLDLEVPKVCREALLIRLQDLDYLEKKKVRFLK